MSNAVSMIPTAPLDRVLTRVASIWGGDQAPHHILYGMTGSGKSTLVKRLIGLCPQSRVLIMDPKPHSDPAWNGPDGAPDKWGKPVKRITPRFGYEGADGGGPWKLHYRITGSPDRADTARRFADALSVIEAEGHCVLVIDDAREVNRQLRLAERVDSIMQLGRSANVLVILCATETGYVSGRSQAGMTWVGATSGLTAAKAGAELLGYSGKAWAEVVGAVEPHTWLYRDMQPGNAGPVLAV